MEWGVEESGYDRPRPAYLRGYAGCEARAMRHLLASRRHLIAPTASATTRYRLKAQACLWDRPLTGKRLRRDRWVLLASVGSHAVTSLKQLSAR